MTSNLIQLTQLLLGDILVTWVNTEVFKWLFGFILVAFVFKLVISLIS